MIPRNLYIVAAIEEAIGCSEEDASKAYDAFIEAAALQWVYDLDNPECCYPIEAMSELIGDAKHFGLDGMRVAYALEFMRQEISF